MLTDVMQRAIKTLAGVQNLFCNLECNSWFLSNKILGSPK